MAENCVKRNLAGSHISSKQMLSHLSGRQDKHHDEKFEHHKEVSSHYKYDHMRGDVPEEENIGHARRHGYRKSQEHMGNFYEDIPQQNLSGHSVKRGFAKGLDRNSKAY